MHANDSAETTLVQDSPRCDQNFGQADFLERTVVVSARGANNGAESVKPPEVVQTFEVASTFLPAQGPVPFMPGVDLMPWPVPAKAVPSLEFSLTRAPSPLVSPHAGAGSPLVVPRLPAFPQPGSGAVPALTPQTQHAVNGSAVPRPACQQPGSGAVPALTPQAFTPLQACPGVARGQSCPLDEPSSKGPSQGCPVPSPGSSPAQDPAVVTIVSATARNPQPSLLRGASHSVSVPSGLGVPRSRSAGSPPTRPAAGAPLNVGDSPVQHASWPWANSQLQGIAPQGLGPRRCEAGGGISPLRSPAATYRPAPMPDYSFGRAQAPGEAARCRSPCSCGVSRPPGGVAVSQVATPQHAFVTRGAHS